MVLPAERVYIFDADGVVIEPWGFAKALESDYDITRSMTAPFFSGPFQQCLVGDSDIKTELKPFIETWAWRGAVADFIDFWHKEDDLPRRNVLDHIQNLREARCLCCLASNQDRERASYLRSEMDFDKLFDHLFFSCDMGVAKPDPEFFRFIERELRCSPSDILFWDDTESHVQQATNCGWNAYLYQDERSLQHPPNV